MQRLTSTRFGAALAAAILALALLPVHAAAAGTVTIRTITTLEFAAVNGPVADYTGTCSPAACTASIDWGDTAVTIGTFSGSSGAWTISGFHTYTEEGGWTITTTVDDNGSPASGSGPATVGEGAGSLNAGAPISVAESSAFSGNVATIFDTSSFHAGSAFTATIDWGDGTTPTNGIVTGGGGTYSVSGSHTYTDELTGGAYVVTVREPSANFSFGSTGNTVTVTESDTLAAVSGVNTIAGEGSNVSASATFSDTNPGAVPGDFSGTIDWGDGTTTAGTVAATLGGFTLAGSHTYPDEGTFTTSAVLTDDAPGTATATATGTATIAEADVLAGSGLIAISPVEGTSFSGPVANFTDTYLGQVASDMQANIDWGDGSSTFGTVSGGAGAFTVSGTHTYAEDGDYPIVVDLFDSLPGNAVASLNGNVHVDEFILALTPAGSLTATEGIPFSGQVATSFTDSGSPDGPSSFSATINWGDGTTSAGIIAGAAGSFTISGTHTYADEGSFTYTVSAAEATSPTFTVSISNPMAVAEGDDLTAIAGFLSGTEGAPATASADFTGAAPGNTAADFTGTIVWGDGTTTAGTVTAIGSDFQVSGTHTYIEQGSYIWTVTFADNAPGTSSTATSSTVVIADAALSGSAHNQHTTAGVALTNVVVGTFTDQQKESLASYTATISWGDGTTTVGTVTDPPGTLNVVGSHTYASAGSFALTATLTDIGGPSFTTATAVAIVDPATPATAGSDKPLPILPIGLIVLGLGLWLGAETLGRRRRA